MIQASSTVETSTLPQNNTATEDVSPPSPDQLRTALDSSSSVASNTGPGDSEVLPKVHENLLNDGIADQVSRRAHRLPVVIAALIVLTVVTLCLAGIVGTLGYSFYRALEPDNVAKFTAVELKEKISKVASEQAEKLSAASKAEKPPGGASKEAKTVKAKGGDENVHAKEAEPIKVEAKIYGEIRDSMVPLVALVSILTVAVVVILGTMLKAAFAPHPNHSPEPKEAGDTSPVPLIQACKDLVESVKAALK